MLGHVMSIPSLLMFGSFTVLASCATEPVSTTVATSASAVPLLSAAAMVAATPMLTLDRPNRALDAGPAVDPLLQLARGRWLGTCDILLTGQTAPAITIEIERITEPTATPGVFTWTLIYRDSNGEQVRPYLMRVDPARAGRYILDEDNGVLISNYLQGGNLLYSDFEVQGIRLRTRELFLRNRYDFEIGVGATTPEISSEVDGLVVDSYRVFNTQKCSMRRVGRGHGGAVDPLGDDQP
jgi:hypothetical protein